MNRILVISPFPLDAEALARRAEQEKHVELEPTTELVYRAARIGPTSFMSPHDWLIADLGVFEAGKYADKEGFSAVVIDTMSDSGLAALRSVLSIPVLGPGKASMLYALTLGNQFSVLAQWKPALLRYKKVLREYGFEKQCASVRSFDVEPDFAALTDGKEEMIFPQMLKVARQCIDDGADVLCLGSTTMHKAATYLQENLPIPVINPGPLSYKLAENMLALGLTHSVSAHPPPHEDKRALFERLVDQVSSIKY